MNRRKFLKFYFPALLFIGLGLYFGLKKYSSVNFTHQKVDLLIETVSSSKDKIENICQYQILSEPKVGDNYVKINFWCQNQSSARSTLALSAIKNNSIESILQEYARIINFDYQLIFNHHWYCILNDQEITPSEFSHSVKNASTIDCFENKNLYRHDQKEL